jgi:hypothetical protein
MGLKKTPVTVKRSINLFSSWDDYSAQIDAIENYDILLQYPIINKTMFVGNGAKFTKPEYAFLTHPRFNDKYVKLMKMSTYGTPHRSDVDCDTTGNAIHQTYHLAMFEDYSHKDLSGIKLAYEFGGGFGNMAEIISKYSHCVYTIQDLKACLKMQKKYLQNTCGDGDFSFTPEPIVREYDLFVSTWALSETPLSVRERVEPIIFQSKNVLIAYAATFDEIDNCGYFNRLAEQMVNSHKIEHFNIPVMDGNHYYFFAFEN